MNELEIEARGLTFHLIADGPDDGDPLLLLHGFPQNSREWDRVAPLLHAAGLRTYALDQRGYSPGARPATVDAYALDECAADAAAVLDALDLAAVHVVGHDWGSLVAWQLAVDRPERVRTLTAVSVPHPAALAGAVGSDPDQQRRSSYVTLFRQEGKAERVLLAEDARRLRAMLTGVGEDRVDLYAAPLAEEDALTATLNWYRAMRYDELAATGPSNVPTTYVWSTGDLAVGRVAAQDCARHVTGEYRFVTLDDVSHWIPDEAPDALAGAVVARAALGT
jgi:pimeloyl-ACP methyl ester carboxylesterase